jgi:DNA gyrase/topoisomerase IV subunit A
MAKVTSDPSMAIPSGHAVHRSSPRENLEDILADLEKETVDFIPNFDQTREEPVVLPSRIPNLLVIGASGIAVGMATNIPPHNLREIVDAAILLIRKPDSSLKEVMKLVPGPDFPTGAYIAGREGILAAYQTGRGSFIMRAKAAIEENGKDRESIVITDPVSGQQSPPHQSASLNSFKPKNSKGSRTSATNPLAKACASSSN